MTRHPLLPPLLLGLSGLLGLFSMVAAARADAPVPGSALQRVRPQVHEVRVDANLPPRTDTSRLEGFQLTHRALLAPLIPRGSFSGIDLDTLDARVIAGARPGEVRFATELREDREFKALTAVVKLPPDAKGTARVSLTYRVRSFSSAVDEAGAQRAAWPRDWPEEVRPALKPQDGIESDDAIFAETVERVSEGRLRMVPPYLAAKDLVRYCLVNFSWEYEEVPFHRRRHEPGERPWPGEDSRRVSRHQGALYAASNGKGSPADLVSLCVAMLRAAGIPARPVTGILNDRDKGDPTVIWAEFYLNGCGWIPFDPVEMMGQGIKTRPVRDAWPDFGTIPDLNRRVPMIYAPQPYLNGPPRDDDIRPMGRDVDVTVTRRGS